MGEERPASVRAAVASTLALVALSVVTAVLTLVFRTELRDAWESGRPDTGSVEPPSIVPVAVVMLVVVSSVALILLQFFRSRHPWARIALTATVVLMAASTVGILRIGPPAVFVVTSIAALVLQLGIVVALWHRETSAFLHSRPPAGELASGSRPTV